MKTIGDVARIVRIFSNECSHPEYTYDTDRRELFNLGIKAIRELIARRYDVSLQDVDALPGGRPLGRQAARILQELQQELEESKQIEGYDYLD